MAALENFLKTSAATSLRPRRPGTREFRNDIPQLVRWAPSPGGFKRHTNFEHIHWHYLFFITHVKRKPQTEHNGVESYVADCLANGDLSWVPTGTALILSQWEYKKSDD